jgi:hypothetical protein
MCGQESEMNPLKLKQTLSAAAFAAVVLCSGLVPPAAAQTPTCNTACKAFQWAYPLWRNAWSRWAHSANWSETGGFTGIPSSAFSMNRFIKRVNSNTQLFHIFSPPLPCGLRGKYQETDPPVPPEMQLANCAGDPSLLNPSPVIAPDVDTLESRAYLDLARAQTIQVGRPNLADSPDPEGNRPYSIAFFDMYNNVRHVIDNTNYPNGGRICLIYQPETQQAICNALQGVVATVDTTVLLRIGSEHRATTCFQEGFDPAFHPPAPGVDGCFTLDRVTFGNWGPWNPLLLPYNQYLPLMNPNSSAACAFTPGQPPCTNGNANAFWDAVCQVLQESPASGAEASYIDSNFAALGITSTGCGTLNYAGLNAGMTAGYQSMQSGQATTGKVGNLRSTEWISIPFNGTWDATEAGFLLRAQAAFRLQFLLPGSKAAYWAAFTDSRPAGQRAPLSGANGAVYRVQIPNEQNVPVSFAQFGSWGLSVYTPDWFTSTNGAPYGRYSITSGNPLSFYLAANCTGLSDCIVVPNGPFRLLFRGYQPQAGLAGDGNYRLPKVLPAAPLAVRATDLTKVLNAPDPALTYQITSGALAEGDQFSGQLARVAGESAGSYAIQQGSLTAGPDYLPLSFTPGTFKIVYAPASVLSMGQPTRTALQPVNADGSSVFKQGSTVPVKFRVANANGVSIGTPGVVTDFRLIQVIAGAAMAVNEEVEARNGDTEFRWSASDQQWAFNIDTKPLQSGRTYVYQVSLNDGTSFTFRFSLR